MSYNRININLNFSPPSLFGCCSPPVMNFSFPPLFNNFCCFTPFNNCNSFGFGLGFGLGTGLMNQLNGFNFNTGPMPMFSNFNTTFQAPQMTFYNTPTFQPGCFPSFSKYTYNSDSFTKTSPGKSPLAKTKNNENIEITGYNKEKGEKLAQIALKNSKGFTGYCARSVREALNESGLGNYASGPNAKDYDNIILNNNPNFKKLEVRNLEQVKNLPAGCILVFEAGQSEYSEEYGHIEITTGDGRGVSDGITRNLKLPSHIYYPA